MNLNILEKLTAVTPDDRQLQWQKMEFYAFVHYGINSFTGREWGDGNESPAIFNPVRTCVQRLGKFQCSVPARSMGLLSKRYNSFNVRVLPSNCPAKCRPLDAPMSMAR